MKSFAEFIAEQQLDENKVDTKKVKDVVMAIADEVGANPKQVGTLKTSNGKVSSKGTVLNIDAATLNVYEIGQKYLIAYKVTRTNPWMYLVGSKSDIDAANKAIKKVEKERQAELDKGRHPMNLPDASSAGLEIMIKKGGVDFFSHKKHDLNTLLKGWK